MTSMMKNPVLERQEREEADQRRGDRLPNEIIPSQDLDKKDQESQAAQIAGDIHRHILQELHMNFPAIVLERVVFVSEKNQDHRQDIRRDGAIQVVPSPDIGRQVQRA